MPLMIAVDLGAHATKVTTFRSTGRKVEFEGRFQCAVPQDGLAPTLIQRLAGLRALIDDHPAWASGTAVIGLVMPAQQTSTRAMELPFTDQAQIERTLPFAVESEVPYDLDEMVLGWRSRAVDGKSQVMSVLARTSAVREVIDALAELGVEPKLVVPEGELYGVYAGPGGAAVVDVGHTHTVVSVVEGGVVRGSRAINVGGHAFTAAIQRAMGCSWAEAEARKHGEGTAAGTSAYDALPAAAREAVDAAVGQLLAEVRSTLIRFEDELELDIERVKLCGGGARFGEVACYLAEDLGLEVDPCDDARHGPVPPEAASSHALAMVVAGLVGERPIDLRTGELAFTGGTNVLQAVLTYGGVAGSFFAVLSLLIFGVQYTKLLSTHAEINELINQVVLETLPDVPASQLDNRERAEAILLGFTQDLIERSEMLPPANPDRPPTIDRLYALTKALPPHDEVPVQLDHIELLRELITFEGETEGFAQSAKIEETLRSSERFERATKDSESRTSQGKVKFKFSIPLGKAKDEGEG